MWVKRYADIYKDVIVKGKMSTKRIAQKTQLPFPYAKALAAYCRRGEIPPPELDDPDVTPSAADPNDFLHDKNYVYNPETDTYITFLPGVPKPLVLPGETHRQIVQSYSNFDGSPATINEISRAVQLPRNWLVKYLRIHEITHDREPFTPEELGSKEDHDLVADALQMRRAVVYKKLEKAKWAEIQEDALKWRKFNDTVLKALTQAAKNRPSPRIPELDLDPADNPYAAVMGLTDLHWGKYSDSGENFEGYSREEAKKRLFECSADVLSRLTYFGRPEKLIVPVGSDFLHIDTDGGTTTRGTPQDMDGTPAEILIDACRVWEEWVHMLRQVAPVDLVLMSGNHDRLTGLSILLYLEALFRDTPDVLARLDRTPRTYRAYGKNLFGFVHGDTVSKTQDLAGLMAQEACQFWSDCPYRTIYTGHKHTEKTETDSTYGVTRRQIPSLSGVDRWHSRHGYQWSEKSLPLYLHDSERGLITILLSPVD